MRRILEMCGAVSVSIVMAAVLARAAAPDTCAGHGVSKDYEVKAGDPIQVIVQADGRALSPGTSVDLGLKRVGDAISFHVGAYDEDEHVCQIPVDPIKNYILDAAKVEQEIPAPDHPGQTMKATSDAPVRVQVWLKGEGGAADALLTSLALATAPKDPPQTDRSWDGNWTVTSAARGRRLVFKFVGAVDDLKCTAPKHAESDDEPYDLAYAGHEAVATVVLVDLAVSNRTGELPEATEENPGIYLAAGTDTRALRLRAVLPVDRPSGTVTLSQESGAGRVRLLRSDGSLFWNSGPTPKDVSPLDADILCRAAGVTPGPAVLKLEYLTAEGAAYSDKVRITVVAFTAEICKPRVIDPAGPTIPDSDKFSKGSVTFVNLDNDDDDDKFDLTDDAVAGGDDELVRVRLKIQPADLAVGSVALGATAGGGTLAAWKQNDKAAASAYVLGGALAVADFVVDPLDSTWRVRNIWIEGTAAHISARQAQLQAACTIESEDISVDQLALTVVGVENLQWRGKKNGCTANRVCDSDTLDADPHSLGGTGVRVFPDARPGSPASRDKVDCRVRLSVAPTCDLKVFCRSLDMDDPSNETGKVDPNDAPGHGPYCTGGPSYTEEEDNRGAVGGNKAGKIDGEASAGTLKVKEAAFAAGTQQVDIEFQTTLAPGDNFAIAANGDKDYVVKLRNRDGSDKGDVVNRDPGTNTGGTGKPILEQDRYRSPVLSVWRLLHIERDSMKAPGNTNQRAGNVTELTAGGTGKSRLTVNVNLAAGDNSANLDDAPANRGNGRFENGTILLTMSGPPAPAPIALVGNGNRFVRANSVVTLPFHAVDNDWFGNSTIDGTTGLIYVSGGKTLVMLDNITAHSETPIDWDDFAGGTITICGTTYAVTAAAGANFTLSIGAFSTPFVLHDDDVDAGLPATLPLLGGEGGLMDSAYNPAYYLPAVDGGNDPANNQVGAAASVPFLPNGNGAQHNAIATIGSAASEADNFWVVYTSGAWQYTVGSDDDPQSEGGTGGVCRSAVSNAEVGVGGPASWVFVETCRDRMANDVPPADVGLIARNAAHEIGHQCGLGHLAGSLMNGSLQNLQPNMGFLPDHLNLLRCRVKSPGK